MTRGIPNPGDILFTTEAPLGNVALLPSGKYALAQRIIVLCPNYSRVDNHFLKFLLLSENFKRLLSQKGTGSTVSGIKQSTFRALKIVLPPIPEQHRIATVLSTIDDCIEKTEALISKLKQVKAGLMQGLLTRGIDDEGRIRDESTHEFKDTEIGRVPVEWDVIELCSLCFFQEGPGLREWQWTTEGMKVVNVTNLVNGTLDLTNTNRYISLNEYRRTYSHFAIEEADILMASSGNSYCKVSVVSRNHLPLMMNTSVIRFHIIDKQRDNQQFLRYLLDNPTFKQTIDFLITGSAQPNFGPYHLNRIKLIRPSLNEQNQIVSNLAALDDRISLEEIYKKKLLLQKKGLMTDLLTGKVRVPESIVPSS